MKKPVRQPTPDEIAAFEETGRAVPVLEPALLQTETQKAVDLQTRKSADTDRRQHANPETLEHGKQPLQEPGKAEPQNLVKAETPIAIKAETGKATNTETRISGPIVRLTIDLAEPDHTRFKAACAMTRRKMVEEVRGFIERRTAELEGEAGR